MNNNPSAWENLCKWYRSYLKNHQWDLFVVDRDLLVKWEEVPFIWAAHPESGTQLEILHPDFFQGLTLEQACQQVQTNMDFNKWQVYIWSSDGVNIKLVTREYAIRKAKVYLASTWNNPKRKEITFEVCVTFDPEGDTLTGHERSMMYEVRRAVENHLQTQNILPFSCENTPQKIFVRTTDKLGMEIQSGFSILQ
jgi:hypothetical protein